MALPCMPSISIITCGSSRSNGARFDTRRLWGKGHNFINRKYLREDSSFTPF